MLKNLLITSIRNFTKEKIYTLINVLGLTVGLTCSLFLVLYIRDELSYDKYNLNYKNIYRVVSHIKEPDNEFTWAVAQIPLTTELLTNYPDVQNATRFFQRGRQLYQKDDLKFYEENTYLADSTVFEIFSYGLIQGDPKTALVNPNSIVLTESMAEKYFGDQNALGNTIQDGRGETLEVTGVMEDVPANSHFTFDALISKSTFPDFNGSWGNFGVFTYIELPDGYEPDKMQENFQKILEEHVNPIFESIGITIEYQLQNIADIHLKSKIQDEAESGGDMSYIYIFSAVAAFMLLIACINYMNLSTARSSKRAKEVGIRKVVGSQRKQLIVQFLSESLIITLLSLVMSIILVFLFLPQFNDLSGKALVFSDVWSMDLIGAILGLTILVGLISGSYPAFYLSGYIPSEVLKGNTSGKRGNRILRKGLVIFQFFISVAMLISTLVVFDQLQFIRNKDLGFDKDQVVRVELSGRDLRDKYPVLRNALMQLPGVVDVATASTTPGSNVGKVIANVETNDGEMVERGVDLYGADFDFIETLGMKIVKGRNFSRDHMSDTTDAALINEAMIERMNWDEPLGKKFQFGDDQIYKVIGVVQDYHQNSLYDLIEPLFIFLSQNQYYMYVKMEAGSMPSAISSIESTWKNVLEGYPFRYQFLDEDFDSQYQADQKRGIIFTIFSSLTIFIAALGLLGLASYTAEQRTKEIGIRKVIGASVSQIVVLVSREFFILTIIATVLSLPVAYYFMSNWLESFAYRIEMRNETLTFLTAAALSLVVTLITVGFHTVKTATANPINSLKDE